MTSVLGKSHATMPAASLYDIPANTDTFIEDRRPRLFRPENKMDTYLPRGQISFQLSDNSYYDLKTTAFVFKVRMTGTNASRSSLDSYAGCIIERLEVTLGGFQAEVIDHYNLTRAMQCAWTVDHDFQACIFGKKEGYHPKVSNMIGNLSTLGRLLPITENMATVTNYDEATCGGLLNFYWRKRAYGAASGREIRDRSVYHQFKVRFDLSGLLSKYHKFLWLPMVNYLGINITLARAEEVCNTWTQATFDSDPTVAGVLNPSSAFCSYEITEPHIYGHLISLHQDYTDVLAQALNKEGITLAYPTFEVTKHILNSNTRQRITIPGSKASVRTLYLWFQHDHPEQSMNWAKLERTNNQQRILYNFSDVAFPTEVKLQSYQVFVNRTPIQQVPVIVTDDEHALAITEIQEAFGLDHAINVTPVVSEEEYLHRGPNYFIPQLFPGTAATAATDPYKKYNWPTLSEEHFVIAVNFDRSREGHRSGIPISKQIEVDFEFTGTLSSQPAPVCYAAVEYDKNDTVIPGQSVISRF